MTLGYVHEVVRDGKVTFVEENEAIACDMYNDCFDGESGKFEMNGGSNGVH